MKNSTYTSARPAMFLQRPSIIALIVSVCLALVGAAVLVNQANEILKRQEKNQAAQAATRTLRDIQDALLDMETGQRGFLLTGNEDYLESFNKGNAVLTHSLLPSLDKTPVKDPAVVPLLRQLITEKVDELQRTIALGRNQRQQEALDIVLSGAGKATMDKIRHQLNVQAEGYRADRRMLEQENGVLIRQAEVAITVWIIATICLAVAAYGLVHHTQSMLSEAAARLEEQAARDPLTGLANRRYLMEWLENACARAARTGDTIAALYLDLDVFSTVNDTLGHKSGDQALRWAADTLQHNIRKSDFLARIGGDEFVVIVVGQTIEQVQVLAQSLIDALLSSTPLEAVTVGTVGASIGIAQYPLHAHDVAGLLEHADTAMYAAKRAGKHCARLYESDSDERYAR